MARNWPLERFLSTTDFDVDLTDAEQAELDEWGIHAWRLLIPWYLNRYESHKAGRQVYCFGVAHGSTVGGLVRGFRNREYDLPHLHLFDSFEGLPAEDPGISVPPVWTVGAFSATRKDFNKKIETLNLLPHEYTVHEGWFANTLKDEKVASGEFQKAMYIDIDADLYNSTMEVLDFMFSHCLVSEGTLIGYDDWGDTEPWTAGESRAHKEAFEKYGATCAQLFSWGERPLMKKLFLVTETR